MFAHARPQPPAARRLVELIARAIARQILERSRTSEANRSEKPAAPSESGKSKIRVIACGNLLADDPRRYRRHMEPKEGAQRMAARALIAELLGGKVRVRQDGAAVYARLEMNPSILLAKAGNSKRIDDCQFGSGGRMQHWKRMNSKEIRIK